MEDDFGFTAISDDEYNSQYGNIEYREKMKELENLIIPFLDKLLIDSDKPLIRWPNRKEAIEKQRDKILAITRS